MTKGLIAGLILGAIAGFLVTRQKFCPSIMKEIVNEDLIQDNPPIATASRFGRRIRYP